MKLRKTPLIIAGCTVIALGTMGAFYAPVYIKDYIQSKYEGFTVETVYISLDKITLHNVHVNKPNIHAELPYVEVSWNKNIKIHGGEVWVTKKNEPVSKNLKLEESSYQYEASELEVTVYLKNDTTAVLHHVNVGSQKNVKAQSASVTSSFGKAWIDNLWNNKQEYAFSKAIIKPAHSPIPGNIVITNALIQKDEIWKIKAEKVELDKHYANNVNISFKDKKNFNVTADSVTIEHPWISKEPVSFNKPSSLKADNGIYTGSTSNIDVTWNGEVLTGEASCKDWVGIFPTGLKEPFEGISYTTGKLSFELNIKKPSLKMNGGCQAACDSPALKALRGPFTYSIYAGDGVTRKERTTGPGSRDWAILANVFLSQALITLEDPGFKSHRGFSVAAFENSLKDNLSTGKFLRGGSTITMQLAKNLWLNRDKTIGRKVQEVFLANAIESCFSKDQIIETYLNVVEFGPDLYGVSAASEKYFDTSPYVLTQVQAFWLVSQLPKPRKAVKPDEAALQRTEKLMDLLAQNGRLEKDSEDKSATQTDNNTNSSPDDLPE
jgi:hypothetical protein